MNGAVIASLLQMTLCENNNLCILSIFVIAAGTFPSRSMRAALQHLAGGVADAALHRLRVPADDEAREVVQHGQSYRCRHAGMVTLPATGARKIGAPQHLPVPGKVEGCGRR